MANTVTLKALGLNLQPNQLNVEPGSLTTASNVIIRRDNILEPRRGYPLYGDAMGTSSDRAKQLMTYKNRILRHYSNQLQYDNGSGTFTSFGSACSETYLEPVTGRRIRYIESNGNFYFTTSDGIKKISAKTAADFTNACGFIKPAGGIKALDVSARVNLVPGNEGGFLPQDSAVAYRIVWGSTDANGNLILGAPSQRVVVYNSLLNLELMDFNNLLLALDDVSAATPASLISDGNYSSTLRLMASASAFDLRDALIALAVKIDADIVYASTAGAPILYGIDGSISVSTNVATITHNTVGSDDFSNYLTTGSKIFLYGFTGNATVVNGPQTVTHAFATTLTFNITTPNFTQSPIVAGSIRSNAYESPPLATPVPPVPSTPATDAQLVAIQIYMGFIITQLQSEPDTGTPPVITTASQTNFISPLQLTTSATVLLTFTIPTGTTINDFYQIYRSNIAQAIGTQVLATDIFPDDELKLVFEGFPTTTDLSNGFITVEDITPAEFAGAFLYTDATNGEGILKANDLPPFALDINKFKNVVFYANTRTRQRKIINLLGVQQMIAEYPTIPTLTIADLTISNTYTFVAGISQVVHINTVADVANSLAGKYFTFNTIYNQYAVWYKVSGSGLAPTVPGAILVEVNINTGDSANTVASKTTSTLAVYVTEFTVSVSTNQITITNYASGSATAPSAGTSGFTVSTFIAGQGENVSAKQVLLSSTTSPAQAVDETARSLVHVINGDPNETVYAFYLSGANDVPGKILLESRSLIKDSFYLVTNNSATGQSFNPDLSPSIFISTISAANPTVITTSTAHGLINQDKIIITNSNSTPSIDGIHTITYLTPTTFSIPVNVTIAGNRGALRSLASAIVSDNEDLPNRIYFSKVLQPDAVPLINTIDVGAKDKQILRIFPLRDSLFVYKEDGLFRISGESDPFNLSLFDSSCILLAPDSLDVSNNLLYSWTTQGISSTSESGVNIISRPIDTQILKLATAQYTNFKTATWGIGYESDNSYTVYTIQEISDIYATIGYRYSTLTNTWTTFDKTDTCGVINSFNDRQYLGAGNTNFLEQERKNFDRYDYADREFTDQLQVNKYFGNQLGLSNVTNFAIGDVLVQDQTLTVFQYNTLLNKLDSDVFTSPHNYVSTQTIVAGDDSRTKLDNLIDKIAADPGRVSQVGAFPGSNYTKYKTISGTFTINNISASDPTIITTITPHTLQTGRIVTISGSNSTPSINGTFAVTVLSPITFSIPISVTQTGTTGSVLVNNSNFSDIETSYNGMINTLNTDPGIAFTNYMLILNDTIQEAIILNVNQSTKRVTLDQTLDFLVGPVTIFKAITSDIQWSPHTFGDPLSLKHIREATLMFENKAFTSCKLSFASDLLPGFEAVSFNGTSNGKFGFNDFGFNFFGGASHAAPSRTLVPRNKQRCRFLLCQFEHSTARESYALFGLTLVGEINQSTRAYR